MRGAVPFTAEVIVNAMTLFRGLQWQTNAEADLRGGESLKAPPPPHPWVAKWKKSLFANIIIMISRKTLNHGVQGI